MVLGRPNPNESWSTVRVRCVRLHWSEFNGSKTERRSRDEKHLLETKRERLPFVSFYVAKSRPKQETIRPTGGDADKNRIDVNEIVRFFPGLTAKSAPKRYATETANLLTVFGCFFFVTVPTFFVPVQHVPVPAVREVTTSAAFRAHELFMYASDIYAQLPRRAFRD